MPLGSSSSGAFQSLENYTCVLMAFWTLVPSRCPASGQLYAALEGPREIRVISISPGQWEDPIRCSLFHRELYEPHQGGSYRALSYAWGSIYTEETIYFQDIPKKVTLNLFCALRFLRQVDRASFLWVDALVSLICPNPRPLPVDGLPSLALPCFSIPFSQASSPSSPYCTVIYMYSIPVSLLMRA